MDARPIDLTWNTVRDKSAKMSARVSYFAVYIYMRSCEIIDYWFPVPKVA